MDPRLVDANCVDAYDMSVFVFAIPTGMECTVNSLLPRLQLQKGHQGLQPLG